MTAQTPSPTGCDAASRRPVGGTLDPVFVFGASPGDGPVLSAERHAAVGSGRDDRDPASAGVRTNWLLGRNVPMRKFARVIERAAEVGSTVLLRGEAGTGKELWARLLHRGGPRGGDPFVAVDCAALMPDSAANRLFGVQTSPPRGSGSPPAGAAAAGDTRGALLEAGSGVLFLDKVDALPPHVQSGLLRVLERREVVPVGGDRPVSIDVQVVAATSRHLQQEVARGTFDRGLYHRLNMLELRVPPLRERIEDIPVFVDFFSRRAAVRLGLPLWQPTADELTVFCEHPWPGNVRQLEEVIGNVYLLVAESPAASTGDAPAAEDALARQAAGAAASGPSTPRGDVLLAALAATKGSRPSAGGLDGVRGARVSKLLGRFPGGGQGG